MSIPLRTCAVEIIATYFREEVFVACSPRHLQQSRSRGQLTRPDLTLGPGAAMEEVDLAEEEPSRREDAVDPRIQVRGAERREDMVTCFHRDAQTLPRGLPDGWGRG